MCSAGGDLVARAKGEIAFELAEKGIDHCRIFTEGRKNHGMEIGMTQRAFFERIGEAQPKMEAYKEYCSRNILELFILLRRDTCYRF